MRIAIIGSGTASTALPAHFAAEAAVLEPAAVPTLVNPRLSAFAFTPYERLVVDLGYVDAVQAAAAQDAHAIMINSFADYGIEAARLAGVPPAVVLRARQVLGRIEANSHVAVGPAAEAQAAA